MFLQIWCPGLNDLIIEPFEVSRRGNEPRIAITIPEYAEGLRLGKKNDRDFLFDAP